jgi:hypothetical protein
VGRFPVDVELVHLLLHAGLSRRRAMCARTTYRDQRHITWLAFDDAGNVKRRSAGVSRRLVHDLAVPATATGRARQDRGGAATADAVQR